MEVGTCLFRFINEHVPESVRKVIIWQDNANSQSKNRYVTSSLFHILWKKRGFLEFIELRFLEPGHTDLILDCVSSADYLIYLSLN